jgi:mRNA interferase MazF
VELQKGDVVLVTMPFSDRQRVKRRPAVVVSSEGYNHSGADVIVASLTTNLHALSHYADFVIEFWHEAGLRYPSLVQAKLSTVDKAITEGPVAHLLPEDLATLDQCLLSVLVGQA